MTRMAAVHRIPTLSICIFLLILPVVLSQDEIPWTNTTTFRPAGISSLNGLGRTPLYIIGLFPMSGAWPGGMGLLPAVEMALEDINDRRDVLPRYELIMNWYDTKCDSGAGIKGLYSQLYTPPTKIALIVPGCSVVAEPVAKSAYLWNVVQVGNPVSPALSNKAEYPFFLRVQSPESLMNPAKIAIMKRYNWNHIATVHEAQPIFSKDIDDLRVRLVAENMTLISSHIISENPALQIQSLKQDDARIIVASCYENKLASIVCEAYKAGMYGHRFVWMVADWLSADWPERSYPGIDCTPDQMYSVIRPSFISFTYLPLTTDQRESRGIAAMNPPEFRRRYFERTNNTVYRGTIDGNIAYDDIWAIALGLNKTVTDLQGSGKGLEDFTYSDKSMAELLLNNIWGQEFLGISGEVFFNDNGDVPRDVQISQYRDGIPKDATTFRTVHVFVSGSVYYSVCCCASVGMVVASAFLAFNIHFRKMRTIKMSSPVMNNVIILGCIVVYLTVFLQELSADNVALLCKLRTITIMVGFSLSFGALFAKTWRVYVIFTNTTKRVVLHDYQLLLMVGVLVLTDLTAFILRETLDTPSVVSTLLDTVIMDDGDLVVRHKILACRSDYSLYFEAFVIVYKGLLLVFGAFLAFQTRKVNIPALNDSQYIGMCVYNVTILSILGVVLVFALQNQVVLSYTLVSAFVIFATTTVQLTIFIPKVLKLYNVGNQVEEQADSAQASTSTVVAQKPVTSITFVDSSGMLQELKNELEATKKKLQEAIEGKQELGQELEAIHRQ